MPAPQQASPLGPEEGQSPPGPCCDQGGPGNYFLNTWPQVGAWLHGSTRAVPSLNDLASQGVVLLPGLAEGQALGGHGGGVPSLPWVHTPVKSPGSRSISGVLYTLGPSEGSRILCACHGLHMSPHEFVQHAEGVVGR